jgi:hypothetical protein
VVANTFWENFFLLLIIIPLIMVWAFAFVDIFRRDDIGGWSKALWLVCVVLLPFVGTFVYLLARPPGATKEERRLLGGAGHHALHLDMLSDLHERGKLSEAEYHAGKARVLGMHPTMPV